MSWAWRWPGFRSPVQERAAQWMPRAVALCLVGCLSWGSVLNPTRLAWGRETGRWRGGVPRRGGQEQFGHLSASLHALSMMSLNNPQGERLASSFYRR